MTTSFDIKDWVLKKEAGYYLKDFSLQTGERTTSEPGDAFPFNRQVQAERVKKVLNLSAGNRNKPWFVVERTEGLAPALGEE